MEANFHIFLMYLVYRFFRFGILSISLDMPSVLFPMSLSLFEKPGITITNALYLYFARKTWFNKKIFLPAPCSYTTSKEFIDVRVSHSRSLKFFCFETVSIFQNCCRTCKSVDEKISEIKNTNKTLETSHKKMLNLVYKN